MSGERSIGCWEASRKRSVNIAALQIEANRAFRDGLVVRANYTLSRVDGNSVGSTGGGDDFLEAMAVLDPVAGVPVTALNRHGRLSQDRTHILNLAGAKRWTAGAHSFSLGGWLAFRSGEPWGLRESVALRASPASATIFTTRYTEPRDHNELPDTYTLDLTAAWELPIASRVSASLRVELVNATDEQEQIAVSDETGEPIPCRSRTRRRARCGWWPAFGSEHHSVHSRERGTRWNRTAGRHDRAGRMTARRPTRAPISMVAPSPT